MVSRPGNQTNHYQVTPGVVRVSPESPPAHPARIRKANGAAGDDHCHKLPPGGVVFGALALDLGTGMNLYAVREDPTPLAVGTARLTIIQANPGLPAVDVDIADKGLRLASNLTVGKYHRPIGCSRWPLFD